MTYTWHGPHGKGAMRVHKKRLRTEGEARKGHDDTFFTCPGAGIKCVCYDIRMAGGHDNGE